MSNGTDGKPNQGDELFGAVPEADLRVDFSTHQRLITPSLIDAVPARCIVADRKITLFRVKGTTNGIEVIEHPDHPDQTFRALVGDFYAAVYQGADPDPETAPVKLYTAGLCFLPGGFHERCLSRMAEMDADELTTKGLSFHLEFSAEPREGKGQYRWVATNLMRVVAQSGRLAAMDREMIHVRNEWKRLALAGPSPASPASPAASN